MECHLSFCTNFDESQKQVQLKTKQYCTNCPAGNNTTFTKLYTGRGFLLLIFSKADADRRVKQHPAAGYWDNKEILRGFWVSHIQFLDLLGLHSECQELGVASSDKSREKVRSSLLLFPFSLLFSQAYITTVVQKFHENFSETEKFHGTSSSF